MMQSKLGQLQEKFNNSGMPGHPVITDKELARLKNELEEMSRYMRDRKNSDMVYIFNREVDDVARMIFHRSH